MLCSNSNSECVMNAWMKIKSDWMAWSSEKHQVFGSTFIPCDLGSCVAEIRNLLKDPTKKSQ